MSANTVKAIHYATAEPVAINIEDGRIVSVQPADDVDPRLYVAAGFIDNQVNGYRGVGFADRGLTSGKIKQVIQDLHTQGITSFLPTIITAPVDIVKNNLRVLADLAEEPQWRQNIPGFHLEGPYISDKDGFRGAHNASLTRNPDWQEFSELNHAAKGLIKQVTLAPEKPAALEFIKKCRDNDIIVGLGHLSADAQIIHQAVEYGAKISTHLGNACSEYIHRHNNPLWPQLANDNLWASLIVDGFHLNADEVKVFYKVKGPEKVILVSDMTEMAGLPAGEYDWGKQKIKVTDDGQLIVKEKNFYAGASMPLHVGASNMMRLTNCTLQQSIDMITKNPAKLNSLNDRGEIAVGLWADLVLFELEDKNLIIKKTFSAGRVVYEN